MRPKLLAPLLLPTLLGMTVGVAGCSSSDDPAGPRATATPTAPTARPAAPTRLNAIVVLVDDASDIGCGQMQRYLPKTARLMRAKGTCFDNATVTSPACAPSRATLMTSQMPHNNGVERQIDADRLRVGDTLQDNLTNAGYDTYATGKYFNGISPWLFESGERSSGFQSSDFWAGSEYYGYKLWNDETKRPEVPQDRVHATTRTGMFLRSFVEKEADAKRPFFAYAAFKAPHTDNAAKTEQARLPLPTPANRNRKVPPFRYNPEADLRDKLSIYRDQLAPRRYYDKLYKARTRAMYDVDDEMGKTFDLLRSKGILDTTAIIFASDNGYHLGENGWETKGDPYPVSMNIPLMAYLPKAFKAGKVDKRPVGVIDIAPTLYQLLKVRPEHQLDGRSLLGSHRRTATFHELQNEKDREESRAGAGFYPGRVPTWAMYRSGNRAYVEYYRKDGSLLRAEFYRDPQMKKNVLWPGYPSDRPSAKVLQQFRTRLHRGSTCRGLGSSVPNPCP